MSSDEVRSRIHALSEYDLVVNKFEIGLDDVQPRIEIAHTSYPGVEAHLFTAADSSSWRPEITSKGDIILFGSTEEYDLFEAWKTLLGSLKFVMESLEKYRQGLSHGIIPSSHWVYHEDRWYRKNWEGPRHDVTPVESFLHLVDESIQSHIKELNDLGFQTTQSCSGLAKDHSDRESYLPYVMFDERIYPRSSAHLFTLADISGWIPSYGPHNFDVEFRLTSADSAERFWNNLVESARDLTSMLHDYRLRLT
jgi:hypothetical protein